MQSHRKLIGVSVTVASLGVGLIVAAFATDHWIVSEPIVVNETLRVEVNATAKLTFGLFAGYRSIDYGFSPRQYNAKIDCMPSEQVCAFSDSVIHLSKLIQDFKNQTDKGWKPAEWFGLFSFPLYVATLVMLILAILGGFLAVGFGIFNVFGRPIETITGPSGLYVWNILSLVFTTAAIGTYLGLYFSQLKVNILDPENLKFGFSSKDHTDLDYSFFFVVGAAVAFILNLFILFLSGQKCSCHYSLTAEKEVDNGMILY